MQNVSPKILYISTRMHGVTFKQTRNRERHTHTEGQIVPTLLSEKTRRFQVAIMSEQTLEWFCNAARSTAGVAGVFGLAACLFAARCTTC